jgi:glycosyltransferase involved in cell wall biosynthesis
MRVCIIYDGDYPWDVRIEKMAETLVENGYEVHLICRNLNKNPTYELLNRIHIHRLSPYGNNFVNQWASFPAFFNPAWLSKTREIIKKFSIGLIIVRDLPLALAATAMGKIYGLPVIVDVAENYPAMLYDIWKYDEFKFTNLFVRNPLIAKVIERCALKTATHLIVVIEESKERLVRLGLGESSITIVRNTPAQNCKDYKERGDSIAEAGDVTPDCPFNLIYVGGLEPMRGLESLIQSVPQLIRHMPEVRLTIVGGGKWQRDLQCLVDRLELNGYVSLTGRLLYEEALKLVGQSDAGIIPHRITPHTNSTIPNKLFEYMMNAIPVIATDMAPVRRIIEDVQCGYVYSNVSELLTALRNLADKDNRRMLGNNGLEAIRTRYNWQMDAASFLQAVSSTLRRTPCTSPNKHSVVG